MSDFDPGSRLRVLSFSVTLVAGGATVENANAYYEVVLPSGRAVPLSRPLNLGEIQSVVNNAAASIVSQLLAAEGIAHLWQP